MYHPWRDARNRKHLTIRFADLPGCRRGHISGDVVHLDNQQMQAERRCTIAHELVHDERRIYPDDRVLRAREELTVERIAARRLIALERLVEVLRWTRNADEMADELWVDVPMLTALVQSLTDGERAWIDEELQ